MHASSLARSSSAEDGEDELDELDELEESLGMDRSRVHPGRHSMPARSEARVRSDHCRDHRQGNLPGRSEAADAPLPMEDVLAPSAPSMGRGDNLPAPRPASIHSGSRPNRVLKTKTKNIKVRACMQALKDSTKRGFSKEEAKTAAKLAYATAQ